MTRVVYNKAQIRRISNNIVERFDDFTKDKKELDKIGRIVVREIKANSRQGKGFDGRSLPFLKTGKNSWNERRKSLAEVNAISKFAKLSSLQSTASFMGDTIRSITYNIRSTSKEVLIEIFGKGNHRKIKGKRVKTLKGSDSPTQEILLGLEKLGYKILGLSRRAEDQIRNNFRRFIRRNLR